MLVLTRKLGEQIQIGDDIVMQVVAVQRGRVRLGITCPHEVEIRRPRSKEGPVTSAGSTDESPIAVRRRRLRASVV